MARLCVRHVYDRAHARTQQHTLTRVRGASVVCAARHAQLMDVFWCRHIALRVPETESERNGR